MSWAGFFLVITLLWLAGMRRALGDRRFGVQVLGALGLTAAAILAMRLI